MLRKVIVTSMAIFLVFSAVSAGFALDKGNNRKGKYTYRKVYQACFERGAVESKRSLAARIIPSSAARRSGAAWMKPRLPISMPIYTSMHPIRQRRPNASSSQNGSFSHSAAL
jgi:hypothetical protein